MANPAQLPRVSGTALLLFVIGLALVFASLVALPTFGLGIYLTIIYTGLVVLISAVVEQRAYMRHNEIIHRLDELRGNQQ
jgi:hypothetical protein